MRNKAFTLIELLVVIAIVGILSSVIYTNITGLRDRARITAGIRFDSSTLHSIGDMLVGEWTFDTPTALLADTSGSGNNGSTTTSPIYYSTGGYNNKGTFYFDGTDDFINLGDMPSVENQSALTVSLWMKATTLSTLKFLIGKAGSTLAESCFAIETGTAGEKLIFGLNSATDNYAQTVSGVITAGSWHHVAMVFDGTQTGNTNRLRGYVNGVLLNLVYNLTIPTVTLSTNSDLHIGSSNSTRYFNGLIDDVRIYQSALSSSEIQKIYAEEKAGHTMANNN
ncbi:MAG: LamG-like jellyroll fold domain-containing protein [Candidatus Paceibacterota bacterium]